jgi:hypothetical protein
MSFGPRSAQIALLSACFIGTLLGAQRQATRVPASTPAAGALNDSSSVCTTGPAGYAWGLVAQRGLNHWGDRNDAAATARLAAAPASSVIASPLPDAPRHAINTKGTGATNGRAAEPARAPTNRAAVCAAVMKAVAKAHRDAPARSRFAAAVHLRNLTAVRRLLAEAGLGDDAMSEIRFAGVQLPAAQPIVGVTVRVRFGLTGPDSVQLEVTEVAEE